MKTLPEYSADEVATEYWRTVQTYDRYEVSNLGRVRNAKTRRIKSLHIDRKGYLRVSLWNYWDVNARRHPSIRLHRLIALAFLGPNPEGKQVNHIDANKCNPRLSNLEYVTPSENCKHRISLGIGLTRRKRQDRSTFVVGEAHGQSKLCNAAVVEIRMMLANKKTQKEIARVFGVADAQISRIKSGKAWSHVQ